MGSGQCLQSQGDAGIPLGGVLKRKAECSTKANNLTFLQPESEDTTPAASTGPERDIGVGRPAHRQHRAEEDFTFQDSVVPPPAPRLPPITDPKLLGKQEQETQRQTLGVSVSLHGTRRQVPVMTEDSK